VCVCLEYLRVNSDIEILLTSDQVVDQMVVVGSFEPFWSLIIVILVKLIVLKEQELILMSFIRNVLCGLLLLLFICTLLFFITS